MLLQQVSVDSSQQSEERCWGASLLLFDFVTGMMSLLFPTLRVSS